MSYPQQQPFGGPDPYGQYGYGAQYGGGYPPPPPPKKKTGAIVAVVAVVLVVVGLGITGFVAPGFFLADEKQAPDPKPTTPPESTSSPAPSGEGPEDTLKAVVDGLESHDGDALGDLACADARSGVASAIEDVDAIDEARLVDTEEDGDEAVGMVEVTVGSESGVFEVTVVDDGGWCWQDITGPVGADSPTASAETVEPSARPSEGPDGGTPTANGKPVDPEALGVARTFLDNVNAGDAEAAKGMLCSDGIKTPADVDELVANEPDLAINPEVDGNSASPESYQLYLSGTVDGHEVEGHQANVWVTKYSGTWCVHAFRAI